jgi:hypothetical protein
MKHGIKKTPNPNRLGWDICALNRPRPNSLMVAAGGDAQIFGYLNKQTDATQNL